MDKIERDQVRRLVAEDNAQVVEVLPRQEFEFEHLPGAISLPLEEVDRGAATLDERRPVIVYCNDFL